jgi:hypothetical protein
MSPVDQQRFKRPYRPEGYQRYKSIVLTNDPFLLLQFHPQVIAQQA